MNKPNDYLSIRQQDLFKDLDKDCSALTDGIRQVNQGSANLIPPEVALFRYFAKSSVPAATMTFWGNMKVIIQKLLPQTPEGQWPRYKYGDNITDWTNIESRQEFIDRYIKPEIERARAVIDSYDAVTRQKFDQSQEGKDFQEVSKKIGEIIEHGGDRREGSSAKTLGTKEKHDAGQTPTQIAEEEGESVKTIKQRLWRAKQQNEESTFQASNRSLKCRPNKKVQNHGTTQEYTIARLRRDGYPEEAAQVERGELSARRARINVGWEVPKKAIAVCGDPDKDGETIYRKYPREHVDRLIEVLSILREMEEGIDDTTV